MVAKEEAHCWGYATRVEELQKKLAKQQMKTNIQRKRVKVLGCIVVFLWGLLCVVKVAFAIKYIKLWSSLRFWVWCLVIVRASLYPLFSIFSFKCYSKRINFSLITMTLISLKLNSIKLHDVWLATNPTILKHTKKSMWYTPKSQPKWHHYRPKRQASLHE